MQISVLLFATLKDQAGQSRLALTLPGEAGDGRRRAAGAGGADSGAGSAPRQRDCGGQRGIRFRRGCRARWRQDRLLPARERRRRRSDAGSAGGVSAGGRADQHRRADRRDHDGGDGRGLRLQRHGARADGARRRSARDRSGSNTRHTNRWRWRKCSRSRGKSASSYPLVQGIAIVQRVGVLEVGQNTILIACSSGHRDQGCFEAARYGIDRLKEIVPVWKKEVRADGSAWVEGHYVPQPDDRAGQ